MGDYNPRSPLYVLQGLRADLPALPDESIQTRTLYECTDEDTVFYCKLVGGVQSWVPIGAGAGEVNAIQFAVGTAATTDSATSIPANAVVTYAAVEIDTPYDGGTTMEVGDSVAPDLLLATTDIDPTRVFVYDEVEPIAWGGTARKVRVTIAGAPAAGAGICTVLYCVPRS